ncbi:MAG TPA: GntR family transcriptional regulator [Ignavibacteria bacterium]|nr:GntR family transcriptional regulator [Ignavibacteria bacterium]HMR40927.1 GntR family transcriptional regulator [Ignavibacteria bacterium]
MKRETTIINDVAAFIRKEISNSRFKSGQHIKESEIAKKLNISRVPVREAFRILQSEGYIEVIANRGSFVKKISFEYIKEMTIFYNLLAPVLLKNAIPNYTKRTYSKAIKILDSVDKCDNMNDIGYLLWDFAKVIYTPSKMKFILGLFDEIYMHNIRTLNELFVLRVSGNYDTTPHRTFLKLCSQKKNAKAIKAWMEHIQRVEKLTLKIRKNIRSGSK